jgi:hypothetical protein
VSGRLSRLCKLEAAGFELRMLNDGLCDALNDLRALPVGADLFGYAIEINADLADDKDEKRRGQQEFSRGDNEHGVAQARGASLE